MLEMRGARGHLFRSSYAGLTRVFIKLRKIPFEADGLPGSAVCANASPGLICRSAKTSSGQVLTNAGD